MTTWLDSIEDSMSKSRRYAMMPEDMKRMARVLREQSAILAITNPWALA